MRLQLPLRAAAAGVLAAFLFTASEWLFFVTKPSSLARLPFDEQLAVLFAASRPVVFTGAAVGAAFGLATSRSRWKYVRLPLRWAAIALPSLFITATLFLLVENFTYTLFRFNVLGIQGVGRYLYGVAVVVVGVATGWGLDRWLCAATRSLARGWALTAAAAVVLASFVVAGVRADSRQEWTDVLASPGGRERPNILLIGADGLNVRSMSAYGYSRETTPFIAHWMREALVFENAFANAGMTAGSLGALLSGKLPTTSRVIARPDIFRGRHAWEHLPGVLRRLGYANGQIGARYHADAFDINMRGAFDFANLERSEPPSRLAKWFSIGTWTNDEALSFMAESFDRIESRVVHAFGIRRRRNPNDFGRIGHGRKLVELSRFLTETREPFFAHAHFLATHGRMFQPRRRLFSAGQAQARPWMRDFYDDAIQGFDSDFETVIRQLQASGRYENAIIVLYSDHGSRHSVLERVPLMIRFPEGRIRGRRSENVQLADVAPTILDYLGAEVPGWMEGRTMIGGAQDPMRTVLAVGSGRGHAPPFYTLAKISMTVCHQHYALNLLTGRLTVSDVPGHTAPCPRSILPTEAQTRKMLINHLVDKGYDVAALPSP